MREPWKVEYDQRQCRLMIECLEAFRFKKIGINVLISALKGLLGALELKDHDWIESAISEWGNLEINYALEIDRCEEAGLDRKEASNRLYEMDAVKSSVSKLEQLVHERLDALANEVPRAPD